MSKITLKVSYHPSGNRTLTESKGEGMPIDCQGELFTNSDSGSFYRAVAQKIADLNAEGHLVTYQDTSA
ncbi:hypothetical protein ABVD54_003988 [Vibrio parahaemolyticus]|nr:hypothetical protein [Vibrio parahaemolyticus]HBB9961598.1 hypothetical protein [Vibrio parahaemolyticus]HBB9976774.1 hypothetical protein [Vibrio parahaemolyticus]HBC0013330.1 hypothetical protein [Vibrio parahaemolyticus]